MEWREIVELEGVAPSSPVCRAGTLLLSYSPGSRGRSVEPEGVAPSSPACRTGILLLNHGSASVVGVTGIAPAASRSRTARSTTELHPETHRGERGNRTLDTVEPCYALSSRAPRPSGPSPASAVARARSCHVTSRRRLVSSSRVAEEEGVEPPRHLTVLARFSGPAPSPRRLAPPGDASARFHPHPARAAGIHGASSVDPGPRRPAAARSGRARPAGRSRRQ